MTLSRPAVAAALVTAVSVSAVVAFAALAQDVPTKPGLWATASQVEINGKAMPTMFDVNGIPQAQKTAIAAAMAKLGLPAGWSPTLSCQVKTSVNVQAMIADMKDQGCTASGVEIAGDHAKYKVMCKSASGTASGDGTVTGIGTNEAKYTLSMTGTMMGKPITYKSTSISRFVGSDCDNPPAGIDASWIGR